MGLGISVIARHAGSEEACHVSLRAFFETVESPVPGGAIDVHDMGDTMEAALFFGEQNLFFSFEDGSLYIDAKTSNAGPGYHAWVVTVLRRMREACGLAWTDDDVEDETGFWSTRDYEALQADMTEWLGSLSTMLLEKCGDDAQNIGIGMPMDFSSPVDVRHYAATQLGWREQDFFQVASENPARISPDFFLWWEEEPDATFYHKCALSLMWCNCNWLAPENDEEERLFSTIFQCLERAWDEDPSLPFPVAQWKELARLSGSDDLAAELEQRFPLAGHPPAHTNELIGYLRGNLTRHFGDGWSMVLPAAMHQKVEDQTLVYWNGPRTIRISTFTVTGPSLTPEGLMETLAGEDKTEVFVINEPTGLLTRIMHRQETSEEGDSYHRTVLLATTEGAALVASLYYDDPADKEWAVAACSSLRRSWVVEE